MSYVEPGRPKPYGAIYVPAAPKPPAPPTPMPHTKPDLRSIPRDQTVRGFEAIDTYLRANPRLGAPDGLLPATGTIAERVDRICAYGIGEFLGAFQAGGPLPGDAAGYDARRDGALHHTFAVLERERGERPSRPQPQPGPVGPILVAGRDFMVAGARHRIVGCTMGAALRPGYDYRPALDEAAALGFTHARTFCGELPWAGQALRDVYERLPGYLAALRERAMRLYPSYVTEAGRGFDLDAHVRELEAIFAGRDDVGPKEAANEPWHPSQGGRLDVGRLRSLCEQMTGVKTAGAPQVDEGTGALAYAGFSDYLGPHLNRGQDGTTRREKWDMVRRIREFELLSAETNRPVLNNEMIGADEVAEFGRRESDPAVFFAAGVLDGFNGGGIFHSQAGVWGNPLGPNQRACAEAYVAGSRIWPVGIRPAFRNSNVHGGWHDSPVQSHDTGRCVRAYSGIYGNEGRVIVLGITGDPGVRIGAGWRDVGTEAAMSGVTVFGVARA